MDRETGHFKVLEKLCYYVMVRKGEKERVEPFFNMITKVLIYMLNNDDTHDDDVLLKNFFLFALLLLFLDNFHAHKRYRVFNV